MPRPVNVVPIQINLNATQRNATQRNEKEPMRHEEREIKHALSPFYMTITTAKGKVPPGNTGL